MEWFVHDRIGQMESFDDFVYSALFSWRGRLSSRKNHPSEKLPLIS